MARGNKKTDTTGPNFKGDPSVGGRKGGVISSTGIDPTASDALMAQAEQMGSGDPGPSGSPAGPAGGGGGRPPGGPALSGQSAFDELANGPRKPRSKAYQNASAMFDDPYLTLRAIAKKHPNPDMVNLMRRLDG